MKGVDTFFTITIDLSKPNKEREDAYKLFTLSGKPCFFDIMSGNIIHIEDVKFIYINDENTNE